MQSAVLDVMLHVLRVSGVVTVCAVTLVAHEEAHRLCARATGRRTAGWGLRWYGVGVRIEVGDLRSFWPVALAGPAASLAMAALLAPAVATDIPLARFAFWVNAGMFLLNLLPFGPSDGAWVVRSLRAQRASPTSARAVTEAVAIPGAAVGQGRKRPGGYSARALGSPGRRAAWLL